MTIAVNSCGFFFSYPDWVEVWKCGQESDVREPNIDWPIVSFSGFSGVRVSEDEAVQQVNMTGSLQSSIWANFITETCSLPPSHHMATPGWLSGLKGQNSDPCPVSVGGHWCFHTLPWCLQVYEWCALSCQYRGAGNPVFLPCYSVSLRSMWAQCRRLIYGSARTGFLLCFFLFNHLNRRNKVEGLPMCSLSCTNSHLLSETFTEHKDSSWECSFHLYNHRHSMWGFQCTNTFIHERNGSCWICGCRIHGRCYMISTCMCMFIYVHISKYETWNISTLSFSSKELTEQMPLYFCIQP